MWFPHRVIQELAFNVLSLVNREKFITLRITTPPSFACLCPGAEVTNGLLDHEEFNP